MAKSKKTKTPKETAAPATAQAQALPLFARPEEGVIQITVAPARTDRIKGFRDGFQEAQEHFDRGATANGKAREKIKTLAKSSGVSTKAISWFRQGLRMDPKDFIAAINDVALLAADAGIFDQSEEADQAEAREANAASVDAAERDAAGVAPEAPPPAARLDGAPPKGMMDAAMHQGAQARMDGAPLDDCPADYNPTQAGWWKEGWRREDDRERIAASKTSSGALSTQAAN
ncbi:MAG: hypothetical protein NBV67_02435 [Tagaea sp.]|nr:hypothetical protein [Tagaea sp.]